jgi:hypothetical protein
MSNTFFHPDCFKDEAAEKIFAILHLAGGYQWGLLGVTQLHFLDKEKREAEFERIRRVIKRSSHPRADEALQKLKELTGN